MFKFDGPILMFAGGLALGAAAVGAAFTAGGPATSGTPAPAPAPTATHQVQDGSSASAVDIPAWVVRPCATEDDVNCRWIATGPYAQGNGKGHTYVVRQFPGKAHMICVMYADPAYARTHDYCA